ncbi:putative membrane protein [Kiritimatiella glycovorans]|uniref:Putative membrane protein n=2 Tax=Kiritimatiella glycovorans TaxID=1307763 RepID=A0A0G3EFF7_9BACT|nr:putative membrane protein [Kiritimatiella glycovorans]
MRAIWLALCLVCAALSTEAAPSPSGEHASIGERLALGLEEAGLPEEVVIFGIATLPIVELRGAVPAGHVLMDVPSLAGPARAAASVKIYALSVAGNMLPVPFILLLLGPVSRWLMRFPAGKTFFDWLFARTRRKSASIEKYETLGLTVFVSIPLPVTGGWTGAVAAFLMGLSFRHAMLSIFLGVLISGIIMTTLSLMGWWGAVIAGIALLALALGALRRKLNGLSEKPEQAGESERPET